MANAVASGASPRSFIRSWSCCGGWLGSSRTNTTDSDSSPVGQTSNGLDFLKDRLELYDRRACDIQWILAALLAAGSLFTLLQGIFAYVSVSNFNSSMDAALKKATESTEKIDKSRSTLETEFREKISSFTAEAKHRADDLQSKLEAQFPIAGRMEQSLNEALWLLDAYFQDANWYEKLYEKLQAQQREEILFYEKVIAGFAALNLPRLDEPVARAFRGLGSFYTSKFLKDKSPSDLDRAKFYLQRAIQRNPKEFASLNMLGYIALCCEDSPKYDAAENHFKQSLSVFKDQQRAIYNLASISFRRDQNYEQAISFYRLALKKSVWEFGQDEENRTYITFNLACSLSKLWVTRKEDGLAEEALLQLRNALSEGPSYIACYLKSECAKEGDFASLRDSEKFGAMLQAILDEPTVAALLRRCD